MFATKNRDDRLTHTNNALVVLQQDVCLATYSVRTYSRHNSQYVPWKIQSNHRRYNARTHQQHLDEANNRPLKFADRPAKPTSFAGSTLRVNIGELNRRLCCSMPRRPHGSCCPASDCMEALGQVSTCLQPKARFATTPPCPLTLTDVGEG